MSTLGFENATPIQIAAIPPLIAGRNVIGRARTGSGKTAAFGLPLLQRVIEGGSPARALVLTPTRELALQVTEALRSYAKKLPLRIATIYGGAPYPPQFKALKSATVIVGTPGRLIDHLERGSLNLKSIDVFVLDEADEMLKMGFIEDVNTLLGAAPDDRQVALFSATMPPPIRRMVESHLSDVVHVEVESSALTTDHITQQWIRVPNRFKVEALIRVLQGIKRDTTLVFTRTRASCAEVADELARRGVAADALHGDLNQAARERVLHRLRARRLDVVIATDIAARGIDVDHITHVINFDLPTGPETYVHRIGRTGRVGREGTAITFATPKEKRHIRDMSRRLKVPIELIDVPSDADIIRQQRGQLLSEIGGAMGTEHREAIHSWLQSAIEDSDWSAEDIAIAAVSLLAGSEAFSEAHDDQPPSWARKPDMKRMQETDRIRDNANEVELFFPIGRQRNVRPGDFVGALANEAGIDGRCIGRVNIFDRKTFVGVSRETATLVLERLDRVDIRGNEVRVAMARTQTGNDWRPSGPPSKRGRPERRPPVGKRKHRVGKRNRGHSPRGGQR